MVTTTIPEEDVDLSVPDQMTLLGRVYKAVELKFDPLTSHVCSGCASNDEANTECFWWYMFRGEESPGTRVYSLAQDHLKPCGHIYMGNMRRIYREVIPILPVEPGENGYVPDRFIPGNEIHAVTKILCK